MSIYTNICTVFHVSVSHWSLHLHIAFKFQKHKRHVCDLLVAAYMYFSSSSESAERSRGMCMTFGCCIHFCWVSKRHVCDLWLAAYTSSLILLGEQEVCA